MASLSVIVQRIEAALKDGESNATKAYNDLKAGVLNAESGVSGWVRKVPFLAIAVCFGAGVVAGLILKTVL